MKTYYYNGGYYGFTGYKGVEDFAESAPAPEGTLICDHRGEEGMFFFKVYPKSLRVTSENWYPKDYVTLAKEVGVSLWRYRAAYHSIRKIKGFYCALKLVATKQRTEDMRFVCNVIYKEHISHLVYDICCIDNSIGKQYKTLRKLFKISEYHKNEYRLCRKKVRDILKESKVINNISKRLSEKPWERDEILKDEPGFLKDL